MPKPTVLNGSNNYYIPGGAEKYFFELGTLLEHHGHRVIPFCGASKRNHDTEYARYFPPAVDTSNLSPTDVFRFVYSRDARRYVNRVIEEQRPDIAHLHIYHGKLTGSILKPLQENNIPIVQTLHDYKQLCAVYSCVRNGEICEACEGKHYWKALAYRCNQGSIARSAVSCVESYVSRMLGAVNKIDHFICVSHFMADKMRSIGVAANRVTTVPNFIDCDRLQPAADTGSYILYFGRLDATKGLHTLLDVLRMNPDLRCVLAGDGPARETLLQYAAEHDIRNVEFPGFVSGAALAELIKGSLCTVLPAEGFENCPMSVLESLACARAVVGSRIGGIPELIDDGEDGYIVTPGNTDELADALRKLADNPSQAQAMGRAGRAKAARKFSPARHYAQIQAVYAKLPGVAAW